MPLPLPPRNLIDIGAEDRATNGTGLMIAFGIGAVSWAIVICVALVLLKY
ncbi:hypothetical protein HZY97_04745 [Sphingomonas sp. R-74633]|nr:hypothetical protein [Sphingomonas sp. R-74633]NYT40053.1 hypothetical protein [Sphingomonas sp. R-74633]